jgi:hypothetical protein
MLLLLTKANNPTIRDALAREDGLRVPQGNNSTYVHKFVHQNQWIIEI